MLKMSATNFKLFKTKNEQRKPFQLLLLKPTELIAVYSNFKSHQCSTQDTLQLDTWGFTFKIFLKSYQFSENVTRQYRPQRCKLHF